MSKYILFFLSFFQIASLPPWTVEINELCVPPSSGLNPYGVTSLASNLMLEQAYDVSVELTVPRSPRNLERGNFMVALFAIKSQPENPALSFSFSAMTEDPYSHVREDNVVFMSRRPTLIPYKDPLVSTASRILLLLIHIMNPGASETTTLNIPMGELVEFRDVLPLSILLDVQGGQTLQVYSATVTLVARLTGIRWAMYNHRIISFVICTTIFWIAEIISTGLVWLLLSSLLADQEPRGGQGIQRDAIAGGPRIRQAMPIASRPGEVKNEETLKVKEEDEEDDGDDDIKVKEESPERESLVDQPADDEDDGEDALREPQAAGTSFSREGEDSIRRRSSRGGRS